jgi:hypothetical protein
MATAVATEGDVKPEPGSKDPTGAQGGKWEKGEVKETLYDRLKVGGKKVVYEAECTFTYKNGKTTSTPTSDFPPTPEKVTLKAKSKLVQHGASYVLVDGDASEEGPVGGNKLTVSAQHRLASE